MGKWEDEIDHIFQEEENNQRNQMIIALLREISAIFGTVRLKLDELEKRIINLENR